MSTTPDTIRVLHVDDEPSFADMAATFMERKDERFVIETATSADEGLDLLGDGDFDCIISDYDLPGQNGIEFLETVREEYPDLPFILYTGKGSEEVASDAISAGVTDYLQKESGTDQYTLLTNKIQNAVERERVKQERTEIRERMKLALQETNSVTFKIDVETDEVSRQGAVEQFFGLPTQEISTKTEFAENAVHPEDRERFRAFFKQLRENDQDYDVLDFRTNPKIGNVRWIRGHAHHIGTNGNDQIIGLAQDISDQNEREQTLRQRERRYQAIFDDPNVLTGVLDNDGTIIEVNQQPMDYIDATEEEVTGELIWETPWWDTETRPAVRRKVEQAASGEYTNYEADLTKPDGEPYSVTGLIRPVTDQDGEVTSLIISARDITERNERERELERYEAYLEESSDIITVLDESGTITYQSPAVERILGYDADDLIGVNGFDLMHPDDFDEVYEVFTDLIAEPGATVTVECRFKTADDEWRWLEVRGTNRLEHDAIEGIVTNNRDITERTKRERELERYETIVEALADPVYALNADGHYTFVNESFIDQIGYPREEIIGEHVSKILAEEDVERGRKIIRRLLGEEDRRTTTWEMARITADGERIPSENHLALLPLGKDGEFRGTAGVVRDLTERKERERQLERQNEQLDEFASIVAHDLRNPLNVAEGHLELGRKECASEHLHAAAKAHERMELLIHDMLTWAREGEEVTDTEPIELDEVIENCWQNVDTAEATLVTKTKLTIHADQSRFAQLLENLFRNAVEHGGDNVTVTIGELEDGFYVEDDGPGTPEDERDDVFDAGYSTDAEGTGFGLSIVKQVAQAHGWDVRVTAGSDGGARLDITAVKFTSK